MLVEEYPWGTSAFFSEYNEPFLQECVAWLRASFDEVRFASIEECLFSTPALLAAFTLGPVKRVRSLACTPASRIPELTSIILTLDETHRNLVERYPPEGRTNGPGLRELFQMFVVKGGGEIYGVLEQDVLVGYVACTNDYENVWDVDFIHVREDRRNVGLGIQLAAFYAKDKLRQNQVPYWSAAANPASERAAEKAGFACCRELFYAEASAKR